MPGITLITGEVVKVSVVNGDYMTTASFMAELGNVVLLDGVP